jgi:GxxExxY protein
MTSYIHGNSTLKILKVYEQVFKELHNNRGFDQKIKQAYFAKKLRDSGLMVCEQVPVFYHLEGERLPTKGAARHGLMDMLVNCCIVVEVKDVLELTYRHEKQIRTYMQNGGYPVGMLFTLGSEQPLFKRFEERRYYIGDAV